MSEAVTEERMLEQVRETCRRLPEVDETLDGFGCTRFRVAGKSFIRVSEQDGAIRLAFKCDHETQDMLINQGGFFKAPYIGQHGWVAVDIGRSLDQAAATQLFTEAYLRAAPPRLKREVLARE